MATASTSKGWSVAEGEKMAVANAQVAQPCVPGSRYSGLGLAHRGSGQVGHQLVGSKGEQRIRDVGVEHGDEVRDAAHFVGTDVPGL